MAQFAAMHLCINIVLIIVSLNLKKKDRTALLLHDCLYMCWHWWSSYNEGQL